MVYLITRGELSRRSLPFRTLQASHSQSLQHLKVPGCFQHFQGRLPLRQKPSACYGFAQKLGMDPASYCLLNQEMSSYLIVKKL